MSKPVRIPSRRSAERYPPEFCKRLKTTMSNVSSFTSGGVSRSRTDNGPADYALKIESFSLLCEAGIDKFESDVFEAAGHKWRLHLYPNGNEKENGHSHISLYLAICDTGSYSHRWEVDAHFKFFIYDHILNNYLTIQEVDGRTRSFNVMKTVWGFPKLEFLGTFKDPPNGFLFNDSCVFGAEVYVAREHARQEQCLSMIRPPLVDSSFSWEIDKFSTTKDESLYSEEFKVGNIKWKMLLNPGGNKQATDDADVYLSIYLTVSDCPSLHPNWKFFVKYKLRIKNQMHGDFESEEIGNWFCESSKEWGCTDFMLLSEVTDPTMGFIIDDTLNVEADILMVGKIKNIC